MAVLFDRLKRGAADCRGASALEFALVLPVLLLILFGTIEYGWYLTCQFVLNHAVAEGARAGVASLEWEDEDPVATARTAAERSFWLLGEAQASEFRQSLEAALMEEDDLRYLEVSVSDLTYFPVTGFLPEAFIPDRLKARSVMTFPR
jgi:hypothetical protein